MHDTVSRVSFVSSGLALFAQLPSALLESHEIVYRSMSAKEYGTLDPNIPYELAISTMYNQTKRTFLACLSLLLTYVCYFSYRDFLRTLIPVSS